MHPARRGHRPRGGTGFRELLRPLLFGVVLREAGTLGVLTALLLAVCATASLLAAWRATRIGPLVALRESE